MEIKKEDLVMLKTFEDKIYVAFKPSILDDIPEVIPEKVIEVVKEVEPTEEELEAIAKAKKIEDLKAQLAEMEK
jgi:translation initiation factor RLI1